MSNPLDNDFGAGVFFSKDDTAAVMANDNTNIVIGHNARSYQNVAGRFYEIAEIGQALGNRTIFVQREVVCATHVYWRTDSLGGGHDNRSGRLLEALVRLRGDNEAAVMLLAVGYLLGVLFRDRSSRNQAAKDFHSVLQSYLRAV